MRHLISVLLENQAGALSRVVGLFSARGYNIDTLTVASTDDPTLSRMTIVTRGSDDVIEQITKQLNKLVEVVKVSDLTDINHLERELMLVKVRAQGSEERSEMFRLAQTFRAQVVDTSASTYIFALVGDQTKVSAFLTQLGSQVVEVARSGSCGLARGDFSLSV